MLIPAPTTLLAPLPDQPPGAGASRGAPPGGSPFAALLSEDRARTATAEGHASETSRATRETDGGRLSGRDTDPVTEQAPATPASHPQAPSAPRGDSEQPAPAVDPALRSPVADPAATSDTAPAMLSLDAVPAAAAQVPRGQAGARAAEHAVQTTTTRLEPLPAAPAGVATAAPSPPIAPGLPASAMTAPAGAALGGSAAPAPAGTPAGVATPASSGLPGAPAAASGPPATATATGATAPPAQALPGAASPAAGTQPAGAQALPHAAAAPATAEGTASAGTVAPSPQPSAPALDGVAAGGTAHPGEGGDHPARDGLPGAHPSAFAGSVAPSGRADAAGPTASAPSPPNAARAVGGAAAEAAAGLPAQAPGATPAQVASAAAPAEAGLPAQAPGATPAPAATAPTPAQPATPAAAPRGTVPLEHAGRTVAHAMEVASRRGITQARLHLHPAELGAIEIHLRHSAGGMTARLVADSPEAVQALQQHGEELRRSLEDAGIGLLGLDIGARGDREERSSASASAFAAMAGDERPGRSSGRGGADAPAADGGATVTATVQARLPIPGGALLDVLA